MAFRQFPYNFRATSVCFTRNIIRTGRVSRVTARDVPVVYYIAKRKIDNVDILRTRRRCGNARRNIVVPFRGGTKWVINKIFSPMLVNASVMRKKDGGPTGSVYNNKDVYRT